MPPKTNKSAKKSSSSKSSKKAAAGKKSGKKADKEEADEGVKINLQQVRSSVSLSISSQKHRN